MFAFRIMARKMIISQINMVRLENGTRSTCIEEWRKKGYLAGKANLYSALYMIHNFYWDQRFEIYK